MLKLYAVAFRDVTDLMSERKPSDKHKLLQTFAEVIENCVDTLFTQLETLQLVFGYKECAREDSQYIKCAVEESDTKLNYEELVWLLSALSQHLKGLISRMYEDDDMSQGDSNLELIVNRWFETTIWQLDSIDKITFSLEGMTKRNKANDSVQ